MRKNTDLDFLKQNNLYRSSDLDFPGQNHLYRPSDLYTYPPTLYIPYQVHLMLSIWRDKSENECTGFFISEKNDPLTIIGVEFIEAICSPTSIHLTDETLIDFYTSMAQKQIYTDQLLIWWHTHPEMSSQPSQCDLTQFEELNKNRSCGLMFILGQKKSFCLMNIKDKQTGLSLNQELKIEKYYMKNFKSKELLKILSCWS